MVTRAIKSIGREYRGERQVRKGVVQGDVGG